MTRFVLGLGALAVATSAAVVGCGGAGASTAHAQPEPPIARAWKNRCGACHTRVEPGSRSKEALEEALARHRKRVKLHESEWRELIAFLARPDAASTNEPLVAPAPTPTVFAPAPAEPAPDAGAVAQTASDASTAAPDRDAAAAAATH